MISQGRKPTQTERNLPLSMPFSSCLRWQPAPAPCRARCFNMQHQITCQFSLYFFPAALQPHWSGHRRGMGCPRCPFTSGVPSPCSPLLRQAWPAACPCAEHKMATSLVVGPTCAQTPSEPKSSAGCSETLTHQPNSNQKMASSQTESTSDPCGLQAHELQARLVGQPADCYPGKQGVEMCEYKARLSFVFLCLQILPSRKHELLLVTINCN